jgi:hypothetical protein
LQIQIGQCVAIDIAQRDRGGCVTNRIRYSAQKATTTIISQDAHVITVGVCCDKIWLLITVDITYGHSVWLSTCEVRHTSLKTSCGLWDDQR